jgi:two-component system sensor histidine kinase PilS (NtrC family)
MSSAAPPSPAASGARERRTRLTYVLLFRVVVVSLLLGARLFEEASTPDGMAFGFTAGLGLLILSYASSIALSLWLRGERSVAEIDLIAAVQIIFDLASATALVHLTGGIESQLVFTYLIIVAGAGLLFTRGTLWTAVAAVVSFSALLLLRHFGLVPRVGQLGPSPTREVLRAILQNSVAILATGVLASRLAVEVARASASLVRASAEFEDLATLYADVVRSLSSGLVTLNVDGRVATVNQAAVAILGIAEADLVGRPIGSSIPAVAELLTPARQVRREEITFHDPQRKPRRLGITLSPLVDARDVQVGQIVTFQDLTELRAMEEAITRQKRLAAIGRLAAGVAHEIRNPLAAISGSIELLVASGVGESQENKELSQIVLREVARLNGLITELLEFARPRTPDLQRLDLSDAVEELVRVFQNDKQLRDTQVELSAAGPLMVEADAGQLRQVVWNLLRNAAEAAPRGTIHVRVERKGTRAELVVRDEGPGIDDEHLSRVFEPFFSTKESGTGLGLPTVHRIVEEHHGTVELVRNEGGGTSAIVQLPLVV